MAIWIFLSFSKFGEFGPFFLWKILCIGRSHIFQVGIWRKFANKKKQCESHPAQNQSMDPIPRHYGACAVAPGIIKKEHETWVHASNPTMAAAPDCSLHTAGREGWRDDPGKSPAGGSQVFFALKYTLSILLIDFVSSSSSSSSSTHHHHHHPHHRHNSDNP